MKQDRPSPQDEKREHEQGDAGQRSKQSWDNVKGEGNYKAAREFDEAEREFVQSGKLDEGIRNAAPKSESEQRDLDNAEKEARRRAKEEDPALSRKSKSVRNGRR